MMSGADEFDPHDPSMMHNAAARRTEGSPASVAALRCADRFAGFPISTIYIRSIRICQLRNTAIATFYQTKMGLQCAQCRN